MPDNINNDYSSELEKKIPDITCKQVRLYHIKYNSRWVDSCNRELEYAQKKIKSLEEAIWDMRKRIDGLEADRSFLDKIKAFFGLRPKSGNVSVSLIELEGYGERISRIEANQAKINDNIVNLSRQLNEIHNAMFEATKRAAKENASFESVKLSVGKDGEQGDSVAYDMVKKLPGLYQQIEIVCDEVLFDVNNQYTDKTWYYDISIVFKTLYELLQKNGRYDIAALYESLRMNGISCNQNMSAIQQEKVESMLKEFTDIFSKLMSSNCSFYFPENGTRFAEDKHERHPRDKKAACAVIDFCIFPGIMKKSMNYASGAEKNVMLMKPLIWFSDRNVW